MRRFMISICMVGLLMSASSAMALSFSEDFEGYTLGSTTWGSGGIWNEPTNGLKLDSYTPNGSDGPRCGGGGNNNEYAHAELGGLPGEGPLSFSCGVMWDHAKFKEDGALMILSDDPATAEQVPLDGSSLGSPINAIALGHAGTGAKNYSFFDGQTWTVVGFTGQPGGGTDAWEYLSASVDGAGNWTAGVTSSSGGGGGGGSGTLAVSGFTFDTVTAASYEVSANAYYGGLDDFEVTATDVPEPATLILLSLGGLMLRRRR